jgi:hypothetical protein
MLVSHFDTHGNGVKTINRPKPNSQGMPNISPPHQLSKYPFSLQNAMGPIPYLLVGIEIHI